MNGRRTVLITGAGRGIGLYLARRLTGDGYRVVGLSRTMPEGPLCHEHHLCDVTDPEAVRHTLRQAADQGLWGVVNAAGIASMNLVLTMPAHTMRDIMHTNFLGTAHVCAEAGRLLTRHRQGRIINISSIAAALAIKGEAVYAASKAAVETFTRAFAREMAPFGVTVNAIAPGPIDTDLLRGVPESAVQTLVERQVIPVRATPKDVGDIAAWLLCDSAAMVSGQVVAVGGV